MKIQGEIAHAVGALVFGSSDNWNFNASNPCLHFGGNYNRNGNHGLFYVNYNSVSNANANIGCRVLLGLAIRILWQARTYTQNYTGRPRRRRSRKRNGGYAMNTTEMMVICREVDRATGKIAVYRIETEVTESLIFKLRLRARLNPELQYFVTTKAHYEGFGDTITAVLKRRTVTPAAIARVGGIVQL